MRRWERVRHLVRTGGALLAVACGRDSETTAPPAFPPSVAEVILTPQADTLTGLGVTLQLSPEARDAAGSPLSGITFTWSSSDEAVATVDASSGLATARGPGRVTITAASGAVRGAAVLVIRLVASVSSGSRHSCAVTTDGQAHCWGGNSFGELGDGTTTESHSPVTVVQHGFSFLSAGANKAFPHTCGVTRATEAHCWGSNSTGKLGDGTTVTRTAPILVQGGLSFVAVSAGRSHTCGVAQAFLETFCWGQNLFGQLGDGTTTDRSTPVLVQGGPFILVSAGSSHTCALTAAGVPNTYCWGRNFFGQLGDGTTTDHSTPAAIDRGLSFVLVSAGGDQSCGLTTDGDAYCWGTNGAGLGDGTTTSSASPVPVSGGLSFLSLSVGGNHICGVTTGGAVHCWGENFLSQLGDGTSTDRPTPIPASGGLSFTAVSAGVTHTCGVTTTGEAYCWGNNSDGQLGDGTNRGTAVPVRVLLD